MNESELRFERQELDKALASRRRRQTIAILTTFFGVVSAMITGHSVFFALFSGLGLVLVLPQIFLLGDRDMALLQHLRMVEHRLKDEWEKSKSSATLTVNRPPVEGGPQTRV